ncbi:MAG: minor capsid protein [Eubacterium sp.]|nr:minor capsid protein [Eubacterium sp.]
MIRIEATNAATNGEKSAYEDAGIDEYEVLETLDIKTCDVCGEMDGHVDKVKDMEAGVNAPPFHPNCRGTTIAHFDDENDIDETRIARDEYGNPIHVDGDTTWEE